MTEETKEYEVIENDMQEEPTIEPNGELKNVMPMPTVQEMFDDPYFAKIVQENINEFTNRGPAPKGRRYARNGFNALQDTGDLNVTNIIAIYKTFASKASGRSKRVRDTVQGIMNSAMYKYITRKEIEHKKMLDAQKAMMPVDPTESVESVSTEELNILPKPVDNEKV